MIIRAVIEIIMVALIIRLKDNGGGKPDAQRIGFSDLGKRVLKGGKFMPNKCYLIWEIDDADSDRSRLLGYPVYDMKCSQCLTFIGCVQRPENIESNFCSHCGAKIIKNIVLPYRLKMFIASQEPLPPEFSKVVDKYFWDLL